MRCLLILACLAALVTLSVAQSPARGPLGIRCVDGSLPKCVCIRPPCSLTGGGQLILIMYLLIFLSYIYLCNYPYIPFHFSIFLSINLSCINSFPSIYQLLQINYIKYIILYLSIGLFNGQSIKNKFFLFFYLFLF